jgi:hypothetical protein
MSVTAISLISCPKARAGIQVLWAIECEKVATLTFDADRSITAITVVVATPANVFKKIEFEENTAFFNQAKTRNKSSLNVVQTISFIEPGLSATVRNALEDLNGNCCLHVIVRDNSGNYHYAGISFNPEDETWWSDKMKTGEGSSNTNTDPTADQAEYIETLTGNSLFYAPFWTLGEAGIPD